MTKQGKEQPESQTDTREVAAMVESAMADFVEGMRLRDELSVRIGRRTTQITRVVAITVSLLSIAIVYLTASLNRDMGRMVDRMDEISGRMGLMEQHFVNVSQDTRLMQGAVVQMSDGIYRIDRQMGMMNGNMNNMSYNVNQMAKPMTVFPFQ